jgi:hypothetical protein
MSKKLKVSANITLSFPTKCIICGEITDGLYYTYQIQIKKLSWYVIFFNVSYSTKRIFYPICIKHKILTMMFTHLYWMTFLTSTGLFLATISLYLLDKRIDYIMVLFFIGSILLLLISFFYRPLRIENLGDYYMTLVFKNNEYANEFALKNDIYQ